MKYRSPAELAPLVGRKIECFRIGQRTALVRKVSGPNRLLVEFAPPMGKHRVTIDTIVGVHWRGRRRTLEDYLELRAKSAPKGESP